MPGVDTVDEISIDLFTALRHANRILDWHENLPEDELPPEWMWPFEERLDEWFDDVKRKREEKYGNPSNSEDETVPLMQNELAQGRGGWR